MLFLMHTAGLLRESSLIGRFDKEAWCFGHPAQNSWVAAKSQIFTGQQLMHIGFSITEEQLGLVS